MPSSAVQLSKFLSLTLRHAPQEIGLVLDVQGWAPIEELITKAGQHGVNFSREELLAVIETSEKKRFTLSEDGHSIRAAQGHSVEVDLGLSSKTPPAQLFHGTADRFLPQIQIEGLRPGSRLQVHLSADRETAFRVGQRHGSPVVLLIDATGMHTDGFVFFQAENGVWLTDEVPARYLVVER